MMMESLNMRAEHEEKWRMDVRKKLMELRHLDSEVALVRNHHT